MKRRKVLGGALVVALLVVAVTAATRVARAIQTQRAVRNLMRIVEGDPEYDPALADDPREPYVAWITLNGSVTYPLAFTPDGSALSTVLPGRCWADVASMAIDVEDETGEDLLSMSLDDRMFR